MPVPPGMTVRSAAGRRRRGRGRRPARTGRRRSRCPRLPANQLRHVRLRRVLGGQLVGFNGALVMVSVGAVRSMVQVKLAGVGSTLPAASVATTVNVWVPAPTV